MRTHTRSAAGFSLIEVMIATAIMLTVTGAVFGLLNPAGGMFQAQPEVVDMQQRLRIGVDTLTRDLIMAGAGAYTGAQAGSLGGYFASVQPSRQGNLALYDDGVGAYKTNAITIFYVPSTASQTTLFAAMANTASPLTVNPDTGCPVGSNLCGFSVGMGVLLYDDVGGYDTLTVTAVNPGGTATLTHTQQGNLSKAYPIGTKVVQVQQHVYYLDTLTRKLMHYDGFQTSTPILDEVVGLNFEYYGEPAPPAMVDGNGLKGQTVTYGLKPPAIGAPNLGGGWPNGENCTIQMAGGIQTPRLANLGAVGTGLVKLTQAQLTDGPWCPNATNTNRFDADLLRIRKIRVTLRLQTGNASLRGSLQGGQDALFTSVGTGTGSRLVGDQQIRFDVAPRNLNLNR